MLPSERRDVGKEIVGNCCALGPQLPNGPVEIDRVPMHDRGRDEAEARGAETLILEGAISDFALAMEEHRASQRVGGGGGGGGVVYFLLTASHSACFSSPYATDRCRAIGLYLPLGDHLLNPYG